MADSFAKISSMIESARDMTIEAAVSASTRLTETPTAKRPQEISKLLSSRLDREILNGMKCVIALISSGEDGTVYFADVVKNVTSTNPRVRALVMIYVEKYAESEPDTALLSINSVQKLLNDKTPNVRSASIRTLGGIRIPEIASLVLLCIKRTTTDRQPEVRSNTALAISSAFSIEGVEKHQLLAQLTTLLSDPSPLVVGTSVKVFVKLKPHLIKLSRAKAWAPIHSNYRRYVRMLKDLDDWSRCVLTDLLVEYCRKFVPRPTLTLADGSVTDFPEDFNSFPDEYQCRMDSDLESFLNGVSVAAYSSSNLVVLSTIFSEEKASLIIKELQFNATSYRREIAQSAVRAIGFCCQKSPNWTDRILRWCLLEMENNSGSLILADLLKVIRFLLQQKHASSLSNEQVIKTVYRLSLMLQNSHVQYNEEAKASIIWTIGEFTELTKNIIGPDVLRQSLKTYAEEPEKVRYELLFLAAKSYSFEVQNLAEVPNAEDETSINKRMFEHVMHLARYDMSTCTRDKARMLDELFRDVSNHQLAPRWAEASTLPPSSIRKEASGSKSSLSSYKNDPVTGITSSAIASSILGDSTKTQNAGAKSTSNRLQSLDEFFGDEDASDDSSIEEESDREELSVSESDSDVSESSSDSEDSLLDH
ncbi:hypothetical protein JCM33374_g1809 [Metschnikowia sp. JCM 33374]|nr:hypothetical protein JCM33374_g1809 [Metschnikowia sp. JCM 33374]